MKTNRSHFVKYAIVASAVLGLFIPATAHGYATNFNYGVSAKWANNLNFMICISNIEGREYESLFIKAVDEWKARWSQFGYTISYGSGCHVNVSILKTHPMFTQSGEIGYTNIEYWEHGAITKADIILPTHKKVTTTTEVKGKVVTEEYLEPLSKTQFYRAALHEFGHALNLGHFDDNLEDPIDIMYAYPAEDDQEQGISQRDVNALNWLYLGFFGSEINIKTDRSSYEPGDTVTVLGSVNNLNPGKAVKIEIINSGKNIKSDSARISAAGTFNYKFDIPDELEGTVKVTASIDDLVAGALFDVKRPANKVNLLSEAGNADPNPRKMEEKVTVLDTMIVDHSGSKITSIQSQEQVFIRSLISSTIEHTDATYIIQVKNSEGYTVQISSGTYTLVNGMSTFSQSWLPDSAGEYEVQIFVWNGISDPKPLIPTLPDLQVVIV